MAVLHLSRLTLGAWLTRARALATLTLCVHAGCAGVFNGGGASSQAKASAAYPAGATRVATLDVHVMAQGRRVLLTNTSPAPIGPGRLWLNRWYAAEIEEISVGEVISIPMTAFRDEHGDALPGGGFFAAQAPERIVSAEVETAQGVAGLVVIAPHP